MFFTCAELFDYLNTILPQYTEYKIIFEKLWKVHIIWKVMLCFNLYMYVHLQ